MTRRAGWVVGMMVVPLLASAAGLGQWIGPSRSSAATRADGVTMVFSQYRKPANGGLVLVFSGTVASGAPGETVDVLGQACGQRDYPLIGGTQTRAGGGWQLENPEQVAPWRYTRVDSGTTFRAAGEVTSATPISGGCPPRSAPSRFGDGLRGGCW